MLEEILPSEVLKKLLKEIPFSTEFPPASNRGAWEKIQNGTLTRQWIESCVSEAEKCMATPWPDCSLKLFTLFIREDNRIRYENGYFSRRARLATDVLAECFEYKGRFIEDIAEGIWHILSEPTWSLPAHENYNGNDPVPVDAELAVVDLFASDTGLLFALTFQLLEKELREYSSSLVDRMRNNVIRRVILPLEADGREPWWLDKNLQKANNWTPWCCANSMGCVITFLKDDPERQWKLIRKFMTVSDIFINSYRSDGACDEGPVYWNVAAGQLFIFAEQLDKRTGGAFREFFRRPLIRKMGEYIAEMNLCSYYFLNSSDAFAKLIHFSPGLIWGYGRRTGSPMLQSFAAEYAFGMNPDKPEPSENMFRFDRDVKLACFLRNLFELPADIRPMRMPRSRVTWLDGRQILILRQNPDNAALGTIAAIKGGDNAEGHNHNDVGQFSIYRNNRPLIVDPGTFVYSRTTFSEKRYSLWWISGEGHNAPSVNGNFQIFGPEHKAELLSVDTQSRNPGIVFELSRIYPECANMAEYTRSFSLDLGSGTVTAEDSMKLKTASELEITLNLFSPEQPLRKSGKQLLWSSMSLECENIECREIVEVPLYGDARMVGSWGQLFRISFTGNFFGSAHWKFTFTPR